MGSSSSKDSADKVIILEDDKDNDFCASLRANMTRCMLYASSSDTKEQAYVAERLANEAVNRDRQAQIVECGGIKLLVPLMKSSNSEVQRLATHTLANLSALPSNQRAIAETPECLEVLFVLLHSEVPEVQRQGAKTVANVSVVPDFMKSIAARGGLPPLIALLSSPHPRTRVEAIAAVANLAVDSENEKTFVDLGVFTPLLATLGGNGTKVPGDDDTAIQVARALRNLTARPENAKRLLELNGRASVNALAASSDARISQQAAIALENLNKIKG